MEIQEENVQAGDGVKVLQDAGNGSTVIERQNNWIRLDIIDKEGQHHRDLWIPLSDVISCSRSNMDEHTKELIMQHLKEFSSIDKVY